MCVECAVIIYQENWYEHMPGRVHLSVDVFIDIVRCVPGALSADAGGAGDPAAAHGADAGPVSEEGPRAGPEQACPLLKGCSALNTYIIMA